MKTRVSISVLLFACALTACSKPNAAASNQAAASAPAGTPAAAPAPATTPAAPPASEFVGTWAFSGEILGARHSLQSAPICTFTQAAAGLEGSCKGPSAAGTAAVQVNGNAIDVIYSHRATAPNGVNGVAEFRGLLGPDGVIRGRERDSVIPGREGPFTAQRVGN